MSEEFTTCMCHEPLWVIITEEKKVFLSNLDNLGVGSTHLPLPDCFIHMIRPVNQPCAFRLKMPALGKLISETYNE